MARPYLPARSSVYWLRKVVPEPLRALVGKRELKATLGTRDPTEAKARAREVGDQFDAILASAKAQSEGRATVLSTREIDAIIGTGYRAQAAQYEDEPGLPDDWDAAVDYYVDLWQPDDPARPEGPRTFHPDAHTRQKVDALLRSQGIIPDAALVERTAERWVNAQIRLASHLERRGNGDWRPDDSLASFPERRNAAVPPPATEPVTVASIVAGWAQEGNRTGRALYERERTSANFTVFIGHTDASKVTAEDVVRWKEARLASGLSPKTIANDMNELSPIWRWAKVNRKLTFTDNPFAGLAPRQQRTSRRARVPFAPEEAISILKAARTQRGLLRWLPWLLCFTGARLGEACQAVKEDVTQEGQGRIWCLRIHEEAEGSSLKTPQSERVIPLHQALIDEGFLAYVAALPAGSSLFPAVGLDRFGTRKGIATKTHGRWVRNVVKVTDKRKDPAHAWRHLFEDRAREAGVPQAATDALMGHLNATNESEGYGRGFRFMPDTTASYVATMSVPLAPQVTGAVRGTESVQPQDRRRRLAARPPRTVKPTPVAVG